MLNQRFFSIACLGALLWGCSDDSLDGPSGGGGAGGQPPDGPLVVDTENGAVQGTLIDSTRAFLGIPYAAPPVGELRWRPPAPAEPWTDTLDATAKGPACTQASPLSGDYDPNTKEDCLTVNVWTTGAAPAQPLPVLVWIHGGGFVLGSGSDAAYDGKNLSALQGVVVVTVNYRLGPLGFLALSELESEDADHPSTGSYGIEDQRAALQWVKANIASFGGDPDNVTLFGESAGGISTCFHMVSPASAGLFERAIIESGPCDRATDHDVATAQGVDFADALGCSGVDVLACLRSKSSEEVMTALPGGTDFLLGTGPNWFPIVDGLNLPEAAPQLLENGDFADVPTILGSNADEGTIFFALAGEAGMVADDTAFEALADNVVPGHGAEVVAHYPSAMYGSSQKAAEAAVGDAGFVCPTRRTARAITDHGGRAFLYHFTYRPTGVILGSELGAFHSAETRFVFANSSQLMPYPLSEEELSLAETITGYWARHAAAGDPNGGDAVAWPAYDEASTDLVLDMVVSTETDLQGELCDFWDTLAIAG